MQVGREADKVFEDQIRAQQSQRIGPPDLNDPAAREEWNAEQARIKEANGIEGARIEEAKRNRVYLAKGPIIGAILIAYAICAVVTAILYAILTVR